MKKRTKRRRERKLEREKSNKECEPVGGKCSLSVKLVMPAVYGGDTIRIIHIMANLMDTPYPC